MGKKQRPQWARKWFADVIEKSHFSIKYIPLSASKEWVLDGGSISHRSGLFFKIVGVEWSQQNGKIVQRPMIEQREIGTLGFLIAKDASGHKILVQAKVEPGNIGICQIGPTYQATASNSARVHNGKAPKFKRHFQMDGPNIIFQHLHSEQGSRFLGKQNRNMSVLATKKVPSGFYHRWIAVEQLLRSMDVDNFINTDARSVLVCTPWKELLGREPFETNTSELAKDMQKSYRRSNIKKIDSIIKRLERMRDKTPDSHQIPLEKLEGWQVNPNGISSVDKSPYQIRQIAVIAHSREVDHWDQPIIDSSTAGTADLICTIVDGALQFYFVPQSEPGLLNKVELGPSIINEPGSKTITDKLKHHKVLAGVNQSDEGGRFLHDLSRYRLVMIPSDKKSQYKNGFWLTLGEICDLLRADGYFTNEARSVLSLVLKWA